MDTGMMADFLSVLAPEPYGTFSLIRSSFADLRSLLKKSALQMRKV